MKSLTKEFKNRIEAKVGELEKLTSVEFVPAYLERCSSYRRWKVIYGLLVFSLALSVLVFKSRMMTGEREIFIAFCMAFLMAGLLQFDFVLRAILPSSAKLREVEEAAQRLFLTEEIFATRDRTGVLIFISEFEKAVYILADKGLLKKVPSEEWRDLGVTLAKDFSKQSAGDTFFEALEALSKRLSSEFPPHTENSNELSNQVRG